MSADPAPRPTGVERSFGDDEIIVTKTDVQGRITYANDIFLRVSAYREADVLGRPHNLVRHPEMPAAIFRLLWDTLALREEIFAYVLNLAGDGAHYWVFAHVTPSISAAGDVVGYHSNRRSPAREAVREVQGLYATLRRVEAAAPNAREAVQASSEALTAFLDERGQSYSEYVWQLTNTALGTDTPALREAESCRS